MSQPELLFAFRLAGHLKIGTVQQMLESLTAHEFIGWQAFERREPFGFPWANWMQSWLAFLVDRVRPRGRDDKSFPQTEFRYRPPDPLFVDRLTRQGREKHRDD